MDLFLITVNTGSQRTMDLDAQIYTTVERRKVELLEQNNLENKYQAMESTNRATNLQNSSRTAKSDMCQ